MANLFGDSLRAFLKPLLPYLDDPSVSEIMVNGPENIWVEKGGRLTKTPARFSEEGVMAAARNLAQFVGRIVSEERPTMDARLPDGSRVHVVLPPVARCGATIAIRKFMKGKFGVDKLIEYGSMTGDMGRFLQAAVAMKFNIIVAGGTGSGKTTLLNAISTLIPNDERVLTIEDSAELQLQQEHLVSFETRPPDKFGKGEVDMSELLRSALRLRPDRIVVGEVRGGECFTLLQAMNTGHGGSLATTHANTPVDTLRRLESLALMSSVDMPLVAIRAQVASAIHLTVNCERLQDGSRRTTHIAEIMPLTEKGEYRTQDLFTFTPTRKTEEGKVIGYHAPTGALPSFMSQFEAYGFADIDESMFDPLAQGLPPPKSHHGHAGEVHWVHSMPEGKAKGALPPVPTELLKYTVPARIAQAKASAPAATASPGQAPAPKPAAAPPPEPPPKPKPALAQAAPAPRPKSPSLPPEARRQSVRIGDDDEEPEEEERVQEEKTAAHAVPDGFRRG